MGGMTLYGNQANTVSAIPPASYVATVDGTKSEQPPSQTPAVTLWGTIQGDILTQADLMAAFDVKADELDLQAHVGDVANPHQTTAAQVGLGNVANLSPADLAVAIAPIVGPLVNITASQISDSNAPGRNILTGANSFGATIATTATAAGTAVATAATPTAQRAALGASASGDAVFVGTAAQGRTALGSGANGDALFTGTTAAANRTTLGAGAAGDSVFTALTSAQIRAILAIVRAPVGQCLLTKSGANLLLSRHNGSYIVINGNYEEIPSGGVTLAPTGTVALTLYYIYAFMSAGVMTLEASTTVPSIDPGNGVKIKSTDGTRTCVGMARPIAGPLWQDTFNQRFVLSWFNRRSIQLGNNFTVQRQTVSGVFTEINTEIRTEFLKWTEDVPFFGTDGTCFHSLANGTVSSILVLDAAITLDGTGGGQSYAPSGAFQMAISLTPANTTEGYHFVTLYGFQAGGGTGFWTGGATPGQRTAIKGITFG